jgi:hypothetical protein
VELGAAGVAIEATLRSPCAVLGGEQGHGGADHHALAALADMGTSRSRGATFTEDSKV